MKFHSSIQHTCATLQPHRTCTPEMIPTPKTGTLRCVGERTCHQTSLDRRNVATRTILWITVWLMNRFIGTQVYRSGSNDYHFSNLHHDNWISFRRLSPRHNADYPVRKSPVHAPVNMSSVYSPVPYARQSIDDIRNKFDPTSYEDPMMKSAIYKKRPAPKAPIVMEKEPSPPIESRNYKKRPAPQPIRQWEPRAGPEYSYEPKVTPTKINPIREMQMIGKKSIDEVRSAILAFKNLYKFLAIQTQTFRSSGLLRNTSRKCYRSFFWLITLEYSIIFLVVPSRNLPENL